jgi:hypothetical protein
MSEEVKPESQFKHHLEAALSEKSECEGGTGQCIEATAHSWVLCEKGARLLAAEDGAEQYL